MSSTLMPRSGRRNEPGGLATGIPPAVWVLAAVWATAVLVLFRRPVLFPDPDADPIAAFLSAVVGRGWPVAALLLAAAPVAGLLRRRWGLLLGSVAFLPIPTVGGGGQWVDRYGQVIPMLDGHDPVALQLAGFVSLVGVACLAQWRARHSWRVLLVALLIPTLFAFSRGGIDLVLPGNVVSSGSWYDSDPFSPHRGEEDIVRALLTVALYGVAAGGAFGLHALFFRQMRRRADREAELSRALTKVAADEVRLAGESVAVAERAALARDLHDVVAHRISLVSVRAETAPYTVPDIDDRSREIFAGIATDSRLALDEMRDILGVLHRSTDPAARAPQPGAADLEPLLADSRAAGVDITVSGHPGALSGTAGTVLYRVVQEGLTNARRHGTPPVDVTFEQDDDAVHVAIANGLDPGDAPPTRPGRGLIGMRERVELAGGRMSAGHVENRFVLRVSLPVA